MSWVAAHLQGSRQSWLSCLSHKAAGLYGQGGLGSIVQIWNCGRGIDLKMEHREDRLNFKAAGLAGVPPGSWDRVWLVVQGGRRPPRRWDEVWPEE